MKNMNTPPASRPLRRKRNGIEAEMDMEAVEDWQPFSTAGAGRGC